jgi:transcriptional regulator with XRE-family HTH domain
MNKETICTIVGKNLRKIRKEKGISIERLSFISDVNKNYISDLERGSRNPTIIMLDRLAYALEVDLKKFIEQ